MLYTHNARFNKISDKSGFTLAEMLFTLTILMLLLTIAVPNMMAVQERFTMRGLDDTARQLYLTAQNALTTRQIDGTLDLLKDEQYPGNADGSIWISSDDEIIELLLPAEAVDPVAAANYYMIKLSLPSATVLEVYYAENSLMDKTADIQSGKLSTGTDAAKLRKKSKIGFYAGSAFQLASLTQLPTPILEVINGEELTAVVKLDSNYTELLNKTQLTLLIEELDTDGSVAATMETAPVSPDISTETKITLDSLTKTNHRFHQICSEITPGANIRVTALLKPSEANNGYLPGTSNIVQTNSLFEICSGDTVSISNPRHLQNLHKNSGVAADVVHVVQTAHINLAGVNFSSIDNQNLKSFDGNRLTIRNLNSSNGLFQSVEGAALRNIRVVDPVISNGTGSTGVLAGTAADTAINSCWVYAEEKINSAGITANGNYAGGLIGSADNCTIDGSFSSLSHINVNGTKAAGGLIGKSTSSAISNSYAVANNITGTSDMAAMFIGDAAGKTKASYCYAVGNLAMDGNCCGFVGGNAALSSSYCAVSYISDSTNIQVKDAFSNAQTSVQDTCCYLDTGATSETANAISYSDLRNLTLTGSGSVTAAQTHPYSDKLQGQAYPFPSMKDHADHLLPFYGDWLMAH